MKRIGDNDAGRNSLKRARKYQRVAVEFEKLSTSRGTVTCYGSPEKLSPLFYPELTDEVRKAYCFHEAPAVGLRVEFEPTAKNDSDPVMLLDFVVPFTEPRSGFGALMAAHRPIDILPPIPFDFTELTALAFDPYELHEATAKIMDEANGEGKYLASKQKRSQRYSRDYLEDEIPRSDKSIAFRFAHKEIDRLDAINIAAVRDFNAMDRYIRGYVDTFNTRNREEANGPLYKEVDSIHGRIWASRSGGKSGRKQAYFLNEKWAIAGDIRNTQRLLASFYEDEPQSEVCYAIKKARKELVGTSDVFKIRFVSLWNFNPRKFEQLRIREKYKKHRKRGEDLIYGPANEDGYRLVIEEQADCKAVLMTLVGNLLAKRFGSTLFFYFNEKHRLRVKGGVYPGFNHHYMSRNAD